MERSTQWMIAGGILLGALSTYFVMDRQSLRKEIENLKRENASLQSQAASFRNQSEQLRKNLTIETAREQSLEATVEQEQKRELSELEALRARLREEQRRLEQIRKNMEDFRAKNPPDSRDIADQMRVAQENIRNYESQLNELKAGEQESKSKSEQDLIYQNSRSRDDLTAMELKINAQNALVQSARSQMNYWKTRNRDPQQNIELTRAQSELSTQQAKLNQMTADRDVLKRQNQSATDAMKNQNKLNTSQMKEQQGVIKSQLDSARAELKTLQGKMDASRKDEGQYKARWLDLENSYNQQATKVRQIEAAISALQNKGK
ncbi:MAG: hypothetical protein C5B49_09845 [Bdellovibrio sp.]|nr:MAG: hypothetical protein C5B49_09845 [Bdellovibrio sp.]